MKILIADDDPIVRAVVQRIISLLAYDLIETDNGLDAFQLIERDDPDILITDLRMPGLDGFELVQKVRAAPRHRAMPIVCLSSVSDQDAVARLAEMGITDYVLKPIKPRNLADRLRTVATRHGHWKYARDAALATTSSPGVLVIDPDAAFRAVVVSALGKNFSVVEAPTGAAAVAAFRAGTPPITIALISEGLQLLGEARVAELLRTIAAEEGVTPPTVILVSAQESVADDKAAGFDGVMRRTLVPAEFLDAAAPWIKPPGKPGRRKSVGTAKVKSA